jgi:hypothetical protein
MTNKKKDILQLALNDGFFVENDGVSPTQIDSSLELHPFSISDLSDDIPFVNEIKQTGLIVY